MPKLLTSVTTSRLCGIFAAVSWLKMPKLYQKFCGSALTTSSASAAGPQKLKMIEAIADEDRDRGQRPDGAVRRQVLAVQHAEVLGHFLVAAHRVGHARAGVHARQRRADEREEHRQRLHQHERLPGGRAAEHPGADDDHHVADRRRRSERVRDL